MTMMTSQTQIYNSRSQLLSLFRLPANCT